MAKWPLSGIVCAALLAGCGQTSAPAQGNSPAADATANKTIDGYGGIKFGSSFNDAMARNGERFSALSVRQCYKDLPLYGCFLTMDSASPPFQIREGIPYQLTLQINKFDKLSDIGLQYSREGRISADECRSIHDRTLDWLTREYGSFYSSHNNPKERLFRTPAGNSYLSGSPDKDGNWVTGFLRTYSGEPTADVLKKALTQWDSNRFVTLFTTYIVISGKPHCSVSVQFSEPASVARPDLMNMTDFDDNEVEQSATLSSSPEYSETPSDGGSDDSSYDQNDAGE